VSRHAAWTSETAPHEQMPVPAASVRRDMRRPRPAGLTKAAAGLATARHARAKMRVDRSTACTGRQERQCAHLCRDLAAERRVNPPHNLRREGDHHQCVRIMHGEALIGGHYSLSPRAVRVRARRRLTAAAGVFQRIEEKAKSEESPTKKRGKSHEQVEPWPRWRAPYQRR
jgi:hypothetical protein